MNGGAPTVEEPVALGTVAEPHQAPTQSTGPRRRRVGARWLGAAVTALLSLAAMAQALRIWEWRPGDPFGLSGDAPWMATLIRGYISEGPYADNHVFGAPFALNTGWSSTGTTSTSGY